MLLLPTRRFSVFLTIVFIVTIVVTVIIVVTNRRGQQPNVEKFNELKTGSNDNNLDAKQRLSEIEERIDYWERTIEQRYEQLNEMKLMRTALLERVNESKTILLDRLLRLNNDRKTINKQLIEYTLTLSRIIVDLRMLSELQKIRTTKSRAKRYIENDEEREKYFATLWTNVKPRPLPYCEVKLPS